MFLGLDEGCKAASFAAGNHTRNKLGCYLNTFHVRKETPNRKKYQFLVQVQESFCPATPRVFFLKCHVDRFQIFRSRFLLQENMQTFPGCSFQPDFFSEIKKMVNLLFTKL